MGAIYHEGDPYSKQMVVDTALSAVSNNPLKNRIITGLIDDVIAPVEGANASQAYAAGDELILNNLLYKAKSAIAQDTPFDAGSSGNIELAGSIAKQLKSLFDSETVLKKVPGTASTCAVHNTEAGVKLYWISSSTLDQPNSSFIYGFLINFSLGGTAPSYTDENGVQIAVKNNAQEIYIRKLANGVWDTAWKQIYGDIASTLTFNANITNYANARIVNGMYWIHGLIRVDTAIAKDSTVVTFGKSLRSGGFVLNSMSTSVANQFVYANGTTGTNTQAQIPVGTYCIDTCFPITA